MVISKEKYIDSKTLSSNLDKVIINESKILRKNLKCIKNCNINDVVEYV